MWSDTVAFFCQTSQLTPSLASDLDITDAKHYMQHVAQWYMCVYIIVSYSECSCCLSINPHRA